MKGGELNESTPHSFHQSLKKSILGPSTPIMMSHPRSGLSVVVGYQKGVPRSKAPAQLIAGTGYVCASRKHGGERAGAALTPAASSVWTLRCTCSHC